MKRIFLLIILIAVAAVGPVRASGPAPTPEDCIRNFYRWYVTALIANREPMKQRTEIRRHATERLLKEIDKMVKGPDGLDGDYFLDAQDFDPLWAKNISISQVQTRGDKSNAHVFLDGAKGMQRRLLVQLVKDGGSWKVDKVQGRN